MTFNTTLPPAIASVDDDPQFNLENALTNIHGLAHVIMALATSDSVEEDELSYLGGQLIQQDEPDTIDFLQRQLAYVIQQTPAGDHSLRKKRAGVAPNPSPSAPLAITGERGFFSADNEMLGVPSKNWASDGLRMTHLKAGQNDDKDRRPEQRCSRPNPQWRRYAI